MSKQQIQHKLYWTFDRLKWAFDRQTGNCWFCWYW